MSKKVRYSLIVALAIYLIGLIAYLPARLVVALVPIPAQLHLHGVSGTLWQGRINYLQFDQRSLEGIEWQLYPLALLAGQLAADVEIAPTVKNPIDGSARLQAGLFESLRVENARFNAELGTLGAWLNIPNLVPLQGNVVLGVTEFQYGDPVCTELNARAGVYEVKTRIGQQWHELGDFSLQLGCQQGWASVLIEPNNSLGLSVNGTIAPSNVDLGVAMQPNSTTPAPIRDLLRMVGEPDVNGKFSFRFRL